MFTGIVQGIGTLRRIIPTRSGWQIMIQLPKGVRSVPRGGSLAVNGICVSVVRKIGRQCIADIMPQTRRRTTFSLWRVGDEVNLEPPLRSGGEIGGHIVTGHIDGVGKVVKLIRRNRETLMTVKVSSSLVRFIVARGSIAIDGISLTVTYVRGATFTVALIPATLTHTMIGARQKGDAVNIEVDMIARYLDRLMTYGK